MASLVYNEFKRASAAAERDLDTGGDDIRVQLLMTNTTADTENTGIIDIADFTTLDEMDGSGYAVGALANEAVNKDDANTRAEFDADDITFSSLGAGTRAVQGALIYKHVDGTDANDLPIAFVDFASDYTADGSDLIIAWNAEGILQLT